MKNKIWVTQNGDKIKYENIGDVHLVNILRWIKRQAKEGMIITNFYYGSSDPDDFEYDEEYIDGREVLKRYNYKELKKEAIKRGLKL